jgi:hypothetical protein
MLNRAANTRDPRALPGQTAAREDALLKELSRKRDGRMPPLRQPENSD